LYRQHRHPRLKEPRFSLSSQAVFLSGEVEENLSL
jgi:hypothetical protein